MDSGNLGSTAGGALSGGGGAVGAGGAPMAGNVAAMPTLIPVMLKLTRSNYSFWKSQVLPTLRAFDLEGFVTAGEHTCPPRVIEVRSNAVAGAGNVELQINLAFLAWRKTDQLIMSWLLGSISEEMFGHVVGCTTAHQVWRTFEQLFVSQSKSQVLYLRSALQSTKKKV